MLAGGSDTLVVRSETLVNVRTDLAATPLDRGCDETAFIPNDEGCQESDVARPVANKKNELAHKS
jgi:hypothetical protein